MNQLVAKIRSLFSSPTKKVIDTWEFRENTLPTLFIADCGSGATDTLWEISRQAIAKGKIVFYFNAFSDMRHVSMLSDAAQEFGRGEQFYVNDYLSPLEKNGVRWERVAWNTALSERGIVGTMMPALERCIDDVIVMCGGVMAEALTEISLGHQEKEVVVIVDGIDYFDRKVQQTLKDIADKGACVYLRTGSSYLNRVSFDTASFKVILMRVASRFEELSFLSDFRVTEQQLRELREGDGLALNGKTNEASLCYFAINSPINLKKFVCSNREIANA